MKLSNALLFVAIFHLPIIMIIVHLVTGRPLV
jgi:hypothetical protein